MNSHGQNTSRGSMSQEHAETNLVDHKPVRALIGIKSQRAFWDAVHRGGIPHYRINARVIRFRLSEVEAWLAERRRGAA